MNLNEKAVRIKGEVLIDETRFKEFLTKATKRAKFEEYYNPQEDSISIGSNRVKFFNDILILLGKAANINDSYPLRSDMNIYQIISYLGRDLTKSTALKLLDSLDLFIDELKAQLKFSRPIFLRDALVNISVLYDAFEEVKKVYPDAIFNLSKTTIYLPQYNYMPITISVMSRYESGAGVYLFDTIFVRTKIDMLREKIESGEFIEEIKALVFRSIYSNVEGSLTSDVLNHRTNRSHLENAEKTFEYLKEQITNNLEYNPIKVLTQSCFLETRVDGYDVKYFKYNSWYFAYTTLKNGFTCSENKKELVRNAAYEADRELKCYERKRENERAKYQVK